MVALWKFAYRSPVVNKTDDKGLASEDEVTLKVKKLEEKVDLLTQCVKMILTRLCNETED